MKITSLLTLFVGALLCISAAQRAAADTFGNGLNTFDIEFVAIGNRGNAADTTGSPNPAGSVADPYRMGKFQVSRDMVTKANSAGGLGITLADMSSLGGNGVNRPATGVSWNAAARFVNWLNTSTGSAPAYKFALQPGEVGYNANAQFQLWTNSDAGYNSNNLYRNSLARYFLPSVDEWYKAAYYDPTNGVYYDYPTGSDSVPTPVASGTAAGTAVYDQLAAGPADIMLAGGLSPYGTMGQGGNVWEWHETSEDLSNSSSLLNSTNHWVRGGHWDGDSVSLSSSYWDVDSSGDNLVGFRVASIPEPSTACLGMLAMLGVCCWRRRRG